MSHLDYDLKIYSIPCCAYNHSYSCDFITSNMFLGLLLLFSQVGERIQQRRKAWTIQQPRRRTWKIKDGEKTLESQSTVLNQILLYCDSSYLRVCSASLKIFDIIRNLVISTLLTHRCSGKSLPRFTFQPSTILRYSSRRKWNGFTNKSRRSTQIDA
jgi:hypothetical protein